VKAKYFAVLLINIMCFSATGQEKPARPNEPNMINPALLGISNLHLKIQGSFFESEPNEVSQNRKVLKKKVSNKFEKAGIKIEQRIQKQFIPVPEFTIHLDKIRIENCELRVLYVRSVLSRDVLLDSQSIIQFKPGVWESEPVIFLLSKTKTENVTDAVLEQVKDFLKEYSRTKTKQVEGIKAGGLVTTGSKILMAKGQYKYVASKNSKVFHRPGCRWAERIKPENLVGYNGRAKAIKAGKRPCRVCKP